MGEYLDKADAALEAVKEILDQFEGDRPLPQAQHDRVYTLMMAAQVHTNREIAYQTERLANATEEQNSILKETK